MNTDDHFLPETVDQQIDHYLVHGASDTPAQQTVQELQEMLAAQPQNEALNRVWTRLDHYQASSSLSRQNTLSEETPSPLSNGQQTKGKQMHQIAPSLKKRSIPHTTALLVAVVFLALLVGSAAVIFQRASNPHSMQDGNTTVASTTAQKTVYALTGNTAYALDQNTHQTLWKYQFPTQTFRGQPDVSHSPIKVINGIYYVRWADNAIYALNTSNGSLLWKYSLSGQVGDLQADAKGAYALEETVTYQHDTIKALDTTTGKVRWQKTFQGDSGIAIVNVSQNVLYISEINTNGSTIYALKTQDGAQLWEQNMPELFAPSGGYTIDGTLYVSTLDTTVTPSTSNLYAYDAVTGQLKWRKHYDHETKLSTASNGILYMIANSSDNTSQTPHTNTLIYGKDTIEALRATDGSPLWKYTAPQPNGISDPTIANGSVYAALVNERTNSGTAIALDARTGKVHWTYKLAEKPASYPPNVEQNMIIMGATGGKVEILTDSGKTIGTLVIDDKNARQYHDSVSVVTAQ